MYVCISESGWVVVLLTYRMIAVWLFMICPCLLFLELALPTTAQVEKSAMSTMSSALLSGPRFVMVFLTQRCSKMYWRLQRGQSVISLRILGFVMLPTHQ